MDVKHLCGINIGFEFDNFPSFLNLWCIHTTKFDIYLQKLPMLYNNIVLQYVFATNVGRGLLTLFIVTIAELFCVFFLCTVGCHGHGHSF